VGALIALGAGFNPILTGRENIYINGSVLGLAKKEIDEKIDEIIDFAEIREFIDMPVQSYSSGMSVRLGFAVSSSLKPDILIVDEVLAVGDLDFRMKCLERIRRLIDSGTTILLVSHSMVDIQRVCNRVVVMGRGTKQFDGHVGEGIARYELLGISNKGKADCRSENSAGLKIHALEVNGSRLEPGTQSASAQLNTGDRLQIKIELDFPRAAPDVRFRLFADSARSGMIFSLTSAQKGQGKEIPAGNHSIEIDIGNLPLLVGGYNIGFSVHCGETEVIANISNLFSLEIIGPEILGFARTNSGIFSIPVSWRETRSLADSHA
jgi:lipopolysaccharide transport system ATP-binding protein